MNTPITMSLMSTAIGIAVGALALRSSRLRGWRELRWFAVIAFLSAGYALANLSASRSWASAALDVALARFQVAAALVQFWAWMRYAEAFGRAPVPRAERWPEGLALAGAALSLVPGIAMDGSLAHHTFVPWGVEYRDVRITPLGYGLFVACAPVVVVVLRRFARAHRQGIRYAGVQAAAFGTFLGLSVLDAATTSGRLPVPYLLDIGFLVPVGLIAWSSTLRFHETALDLERLRNRLESLVEERTRELAATQELLVRAERLASLGQLANGVAHQVSNPASVVTANLRFLAESLADPESREVVGDALAAMRRINDLVRRLADAGRIASAAQATAQVEVGQVVERAVADARSRLPAHVALDAQVPAGLVVRTRTEVLEQVLHSLLANATDALPPGRPGRIELRAERRAGGIRLTVSDDGVGMRPEVLERAFEPFFTTKPAGQGSGLGLPISRGIVEVHGGALWLESTPEHGTTAVLVLPEAAG